MSANTTEFGKWRSMLWPIHNFELKKLLPMALLFFLILFNYTVLRDTKDALVITAAGSGAQAIPFLKMWAVLPMALLFMVFYSKMSNKLSKTALFYSTLTPFLVFFALFATVIYPLKDVLHPHEFADKLQAILPDGLSGLVAVIRNWSFSLFYVMSELWGSVGVSLLFWGFANDITKISESKRFYAIFGMFANLALIVSGPVIIKFANIRASLPPDVDAWHMTLLYLMGIVVANGIAAMGIYAYINKSVLKDQRFAKTEEVKKKKNKPKLSIKESFTFILKSKYLGCIALLVVSYGICINLVEVIWKGQLKLQYPNPNEYAAFMGKFSLITGIVTIAFIYIFGKNAMSKFGWKKTAQITPAVLLITGTFFLGFIIFRDSLEGLVSSMGTTTLALAVIFGMSQNFLTKACKYSFFDPTKETAYIPLDEESKVKGKAAVDVVGARLGKSGGSLIQQGLLAACGTMAAITPYVAVLLFVFIAMWFTASKSLSKQYSELTAEKDAEAAATEKEPATAGA